MRRFRKVLVWLLTPLKLAFALTLHWLAWLLYYADVSSKLSGLTANEMGGFLAGIAAPFAFLWLVIAVFLQRQQLSVRGAELRTSTEALKL
ncbi:exported protein of unknown function [Candidatus Filomicrobium marinum]|uniref:Uncharacterized protein n=1 Tax=Candidatus Filomicrobium marinum TaxID=1608628 RepID=A0A0D6JAS5_9HYPH|nr:hypothetical protein [Candidatus Filomicrobium marinum]CFX03330.1 exported protein of unknown function [Candidatus Filomicrobium marinum]CPR15824.1 exported protein of unknown function [Candidatus Filomicrobium marinum]